MEAFPKINSTPRALGNIANQENQYNALSNTQTNNPLDNRVETIDLTAKSNSILVRFLNSKNNNFKKIQSESGMEYLAKLMQYLAKLNPKSLSFDDNSPFKEEHATFTPLHEYLVSLEKTGRKITADQYAGIYSMFASMSYAIKELKFGAFDGPLISQASQEELIFIAEFNFKNNLMHLIASGFKASEAKSLADLKISELKKRNIPELKDLDIFKMKEFNDIKVEDLGIFKMQDSEIEARIEDINKKHLFAKLCEKSFNPNHLYRIDLEKNSTRVISSENAPYLLASLTEKLANFLFYSFFLDGKFGDLKDYVNIKGREQLTKEEIACIEQFSSYWPKNLVKDLLKSVQSTKLKNGEIIINKSGVDEIKEKITFISLLAAALYTKSGNRKALMYLEALSHSLYFSQKGEKVDCKYYDRNISYLNYNNIVSIVGETAFINDVRHDHAAQQKAKDNLTISVDQPFAELCKKFIDEILKKLNDKNDKDNKKSVLISFNVMTAIIKSKIQHIKPIQFDKIGSLFREEFMDIPSLSNKRKDQSPSNNIKQLPFLFDDLASSTESEMVSISQIG